jgi:hypothetical protein
MFAEVEAVRAGGRGCIGGVGEVGPCEVTCSKPEESELSDMIGIRRLVRVGGLELDGSVETTVMKPFESSRWAH